jgi:hypothetical protein
LEIDKTERMRTKMERNQSRMTKDRKERKGAIKDDDEL